MPTTTNAATVEESTNGDAVANAAEAFQHVDVEGDRVLLHNFQVQNRDVAAYLGELPVEERAAAFTRAVEVGVFCLERASNSADVDFVKRQVERLVADLEKKVGSIPDVVRDELLKKVGTGDGQVLKPIEDATQFVSKALAEKLTEVKQLFAEVLDPARDSSTVGKLLKVLVDLLDPGRTDSVQGSIEMAIKGVTGEDGVLAKSVKAVVAEAMVPLKEEIDSLALEIRGKEAATEALQQTTAKGAPYEEEVVQVLQPWAKAVGAGVEHVGGDNKPGDVVITLTSSSIAGTPLRLVIEARNRESGPGRKAVSDDLARKMIERSANAAIYVTPTAAGLAREIGDWCEGENDHGPWIATTHAHLHTAVRLLIVLNKLRSMRSEMPEFDGSLVEGQIGRIRTALKRIKNINTSVTAIHDSADGIKSEADTLKEEIRDALAAIEDAVRKAGPGGHAA